MQYILFVMFLISFTSLQAKVLTTKEINELLNNNIDLHRDTFYGITKHESHFDTDIVGDHGASIGLLQLHKATVKSLYKQKKLEGLEWKIDTLDDALRLRIDPAYNLTVGQILWNDNKGILERAAKKHKIELTKQRLLDLCIMSHNQGVRKTIDRNLLNKEKKNKNVDDYLKKVKLYSGEYDG